jgi:cell division protein FtsZ
VQLINTQGKRDGTTGMLVEEAYAPSAAPSFAGSLRSSGRGADSAPATAELPSDYLDIPAFLRRQAD